MKQLIMAAVAACLSIGPAMIATAQEQTEQPGYAVVERAGEIELREYKPMIVAEASVSGPRGRAMNRGFRIIADYIFGNNLSQSKVAMTSPVTQQAVSEKIAMTSPVTQQSDGETWQVRFIMPSKYTMETLPTPNNPAVKLVEVPAKRVAVIRFAGWAWSETIEERERQLKAYLAVHELPAAASPTYAFYDPPGTPPERRRNEVMIELAPAAE